MKAVILAAGRGTRIRSVHGERPKCLIEVDNTTILDHQLDALAMAGINDIAIVVGYEKEQIIAHVNAMKLITQNVHFIENPVFASTNNIYSLWLALDWLRGDSFIVFNADTIFDPEILHLALRPCAPISLSVDPLWRDETTKVIIVDDHVIRVSKKISREEFSGTSIGITVFCKAVQDRFFHKMHDLIAASHVNELFTVAVEELANEGVTVGFTSTDGLPWAEIDDPVDLTFAQQNVFPQLATAVI
jgi:L-glutamine-phosphate cytidylyltransferase